MRKILKKSSLLLLLILAIILILPSDAEAAVKLNKRSVTVLKGKTYTIKRTGTKKRAIWKTSRRTIVKLIKKRSSYVKVRAVKVGRATVSAKIGRKTYRCIVRVVDPKISVKKLTLSQGKSKTLKVKGGSGRITWRSRNKAIATVSSKGRVRAKKAGTVTIIATQNKRRMTCKVTVPAKKATPKPTPTKLPSLNARDIKLNVGGGYQLKVLNAKSSVKWSSDNSKIASVSNSGKVIGVGKGTTTVRAKVDSYTLTCKVIVNANNPNPPAEDDFEKYMAKGALEDHVNGVGANGYLARLKRFSDNKFTLTAESRQVEQRLKNLKNDAAIKDMLANYNNYTIAQLQAKYDEIDRLVKQLKVKRELVYYPESSKAILNLINNYRVSKGLNRLVHHSTTEKYARLQAGYCAYKYDSKSAQYGIGFLREHHASQISVAIPMGTNSPETVMNLWLQSTGGHKEFIEEDFHKYGDVAYYSCNDEDGGVWSKVIFHSESDFGLGSASSYCPETPEYLNLIIKNCKTSNEIL